MMMKKMALSLSMLLFAGFLLITPASADTVQLTLSDPIQTGSAGATLTFNATVSAPATNGATEFLNGDASNTELNAGIAGTNAIDDSAFLLNFPLSLDPGDSFTGTLFTVALPGNLAPGAYAGSFEILGGPDSSSLDGLATSNFEVVTQALSPVPEPNPLFLLATGLAIPVAFHFGRRRLSAASL